jgi:hypothetical protein
MTPSSCAGAFIQIGRMGLFPSQTVRTFGGGHFPTGPVNIRSSQIWRIRQICPLLAAGHFPLTFSEQDDHADKALAKSKSAHAPNMPLSVVATNDHGNIAQPGPPSQRA